MDNILILLSFVFLVRKMNSNEINDLTFKSDRPLGASLAAFVLSRPPWRPI